MPAIVVVHDGRISGRWQREWNEEDTAAAAAPMAVAAAAPPQPPRPQRRDECAVLVVVFPVDDDGTGIQVFELVGGGRAEEDNASDRCDVHDDDDVVVFGRDRRGAGPYLRFGIVHLLALARGRGRLDREVRCE